MGFHEVLFPVNLSYSSRGGPGFNTSIIELDSGKEERIAHWNQARRRYNAAYSIRDFDQLTILINFYIARLGPAYGFRFRDHLDFTTAPDHRSAPSDTDFQIGIGDASETVFQLLKQYTSGPTTRTRYITKPILGTTVVALDGVSQPSGWTVNITTGEVTFSVAPGGSVVVTAGCEFDVPVRFGRELDLSMPLSIDTFRTGGIDDIPIVEIVPDVMEDEFYYGASDYITDDGESPITPSLSPTDIRVYVFKMIAAHMTLTLPNPADYTGGGPYWYIVNHPNSTKNVIIKDYGGSPTLVTLTPGNGAIVVLESVTDTWWIF